MTSISLIAAVDEKMGIGKNNQLLCHLPADLQYFKKMTLGKPIIMGRKTYESIGRPLPNRTNIVLTHRALKIEGVKIAHNWNDALLLTDNRKEVMVIGGESIYKEALMFADKIYLTQIHHTFNADVFFPEILMKQWNCINKETRLADEKNPFDISFLVFEKASSEQ